MNFQNDHLAYFITWRTYGSWLPGDKRGWQSKKSGTQKPNNLLETKSKRVMTESALVLFKSQRELVERTIKEHCAYRNWQLFAVNCRTNHVHLVVGTAVLVKKVLSELKAWCTRRLNKHSDEMRENWWGELGSCKYINDEEALDQIVIYVNDVQDRKSRDN